MRELKFRAWNLDYKWMDYDFYVSSHGVFFRPASKTYDTPNTEIEEEPNLILMQFTGLKDKNGNDIYEGDIVAGFESGLTGEVYYSIDDGAFIFITNNTGGGMATQLYMDNFEILGNIHEHPHLLQKEQN